MMLDLFGAVKSDVIHTEGIKYAGSKLRLIPHLFSALEGIEYDTVLDVFSGSTRVSQAFAQIGKCLYSNDLAVWSSVFLKCYLKNENEKKYYQEAINHLNNLKPTFGWFSEHYGGTENETKKLWQLNNTMRLDAIRDEIDSIAESEIQKSVLLTSLILALDEVDSTIGHFSSYLNQWSPRSYKTMKLKVPRLFRSRVQEHSVFNLEASEFAGVVTGDLAYLDPPYGSNNELMPPSRVRYSAYYHIWTTICLNDRPKLFGKVNRRLDSSDKISYSFYEDFRKGNDGKFIAVSAISNLIQQLDVRYVLLSYSSGGRATKQELMDILENNGKILNTYSIDYKRNVMATMRWTNDWIKANEEPNSEYLFLLEKS